MKYAHVIHYFNSAPWAILPEKLHAILSVIELRAAGLTLSDSEIESRIGNAGDGGVVAAPTAVAVIPILGTIAHRAGLLRRASGGMSVEDFRKDFRSALRNPDVSAILLDIDSPGGTTSGVEELHDEIFSGRQHKRIIASVNSLAASAAYWLASAAQEISITPSGHVGSIGVLGVHMDASKKAESEGITVSVVAAGKYKAEASEFTPLTESARAHLQALVDDRYDAFIRAVARGRGVSQKSVRNGFGEGRLVTAREALAMGMVDAIETMDQTISRTVRRASNAKRVGEAVAWQIGLGDDNSLSTDANVEMATRLKLSAKEETLLTAQTIIAVKNKWDNVDEARGWAKDNGYRVHKVAETETSWLFSQRDPGDFESLRTICINPGPDTLTTSEQCKMLMVGGRLKASAEALPVPVEAEGVDEFLQAGVIPSNVSEQLAPEGTVWNAPALKDFTSKTWDELTDSEKRRIAMHAAWASAMPPPTFGDIKLFHHAPSNGAVVPNGVRNALARLNQTQGLGADRGRVEAHLRQHMDRIQQRRERAMANPKMDPRRVALELLELG